MGPGQEPHTLCSEERTIIFLDVLKLRVMPRRVQECCECGDGAAGPHARFGLQTNCTKHTFTELPMKRIKQTSNKRFVCACLLSSVVSFPPGDQALNTLKGSCDWTLRRNVSAFPAEITRFFCKTSRRCKCKLKTVSQPTNKAHCSRTHRGKCGQHLFGFLCFCIITGRIFRKILQITTVTFKHCVSHFHFCSSETRLIL